MEGFLLFVGTLAILTYMLQFKKAKKVMIGLCILSFLVIKFM